MMEYDFSRLREIEGLDTNFKNRGFADNLAYFAALDKFLEESRFYLRDYTPAVVIYSDEMRKKFLDDVKRIHDNLSALGMLNLASTVFALNASAAKGNADVLEDDLLFFNSENDIMAAQIALSQTGKILEAKPAAKPLILAVDDKPELLTAVVDMLNDRFTVMAVTNGKAALKAVEKRNPSIFLFDIEMPEMNGYELAALVRQKEQFKNTPIIFLSAKGTREHVISAIEHGVNDYIIKPVKKDLLISKIEQFL